MSVLYFSITPLLWMQNFTFCFDKKVLREKKGLKKPSIFVENKYKVACLKIIFKEPISGCPAVEIPSLLYDFCIVLPPGVLTL